MVLGRGLEELDEVPVGIDPPRFLPRLGLVELGEHPLLEPGEVDVEPVVVPVDPGRIEVEPRLGRDSLEERASIVGAEDVLVVHDEGPEDLGSALRLHG